MNYIQSLDNILADVASKHPLPWMIIENDDEKSLWRWQIHSSDGSKLMLCQTESQALELIARVEANKSEKAA